jgi:hypothetical protein
MKISKKNINKTLIFIGTILIIIVILYIFKKNMTNEHFYVINSKEVNLLNMPLRYQWNTNQGYCGEVCFITAGLMLGQYFSQYDIRNISNCSYEKPCGCDGKIPLDCKIQSDKDKSQLLLGINDDKIAKKLHFKYEKYYSDKGQQEKYYNWIRKNLSAKNIIVSALYENFGDKFFKAWNNNKPSDKDKFGDGEYDHIILITNITKNDLYINDLGNYQNYLIDATDNDRYNQQQFFDSLEYKNLEYIFKIPLKEGIKGREDANKDTKYPYLIPYRANYGISISGLSDKYNNNDLIPLSIEVDKNYELPRVQENTENRPTPMKLKLTITTKSKLIPSKTYLIIKFNDITKVTKSGSNNIIVNNASNNFKLSENGSVTNAAINIPKNIDTYTFDDYILSSDQAIYRCYSI